MASMWKCTFRRAAAVVVVAMLAAMLSPAASAQENRLEFSLDGNTWGTELPGAIFESGVLLVPGESVTGTFHLRSTAPTAGVLEMSLVNVRATGEDAAQHFGVSARATAGSRDSRSGLSRTTFGDLAEGTPVGAPLRLEPGESAIISLTIDLAASPEGAYAQNSVIGTDLSLVFTDELEWTSTPSGPRSDDLPAPPLSIPLSPSDPAGTSPQPVVPAIAGDDRTSADGAAGPSWGETSGPLAVTGTEARRLVVLALATTLLGAVVYTGGRRHRTEEHS